jgi:uncharacterized protein
VTPTKVAFAAVALFAVWLGILFVGQRRIIYFPRRAGPLRAMEGLRTISLATNAGSVEALYLPAAPPHDTRAPLVIFMHGNAELADEWIPEFQTVQQWGVGALLLEYPGYGRSEGSPTETSVTAAALAAYDWATAQPEVDSNRIVVHGRSLGGGAATRIATERHVAALILQSTFTSVRAFATRFLAPGFIVRDAFDILGRLQSYKGPLLVIHGIFDATIPIAHGRALGAVPGAEYIELPCGHNDCPQQWDVIRTFLMKHNVLPGR